MKVVESVTALKQLILLEREKGKNIGFVPTMGALHQGHISLVEEAAKVCQFIVVSIFVNPTQFNNREDLKKYPRNLDADIALLDKSGCNLIFAPSVDEMYPEPDNRIFDFGNIEKVMEGLHRPGHFNGVAQVVSKLFDMVQPNMAFFGLKDFQQVAIINRLVEVNKIVVDIIACPIVRESDGLAMSSRNVLLLPDERKKASIIASSLLESLTFVGSMSINEVKKFVVEKVNKTDGFTVEYFEIVDGNSLEEVADWSDSQYIVGCIAVFVGSVRLIDNVIYKTLNHETSL